MTDHHVHHQPDDFDTHGMLLFGEDTLYLSHLPMFMSIHNHQIIMEVTLTAGQGDAQAIYRTDRRSSGARFYTFVPEKFSLRRLGAEGAEALRSFKGTVVRGHFEKPGKKAILTDVTVNVVNLIHFRMFDDLAETLPELEYLLFGCGQEMYMAHFITKAPDFDQIVPVTSISHNFSDETLRRGVRLSFPGRKNEIRSRLRVGAPVSALLELALETATEFYLEEGELAEEATFDTTAEEMAAGFA